MQDEPTSLRIEDPGIRSLFSEAARYQAWLDVEAALAQVQAELDIIPAEAAAEITRKAKLSYLDMDAVREGLARTGHPLVPLVWELDRVCDGDAGGYVHWGATTQNITQTGQLLLVRRAHTIFLTQIAALLNLLADLAEETKDALLPGRTHGQHAVPATSATRWRYGSTSCAATWNACAAARSASSSPCWAAVPARWRRWASWGCRRRR